jgi:hypothetical protein
VKDKVCTKTEVDDNAVNQELIAVSNVGRAVDALRSQYAETATASSGRSSSRTKTNICPS